MDPQSMAFQPQGDGWRLQNELTRLQAVQQDHAERLMQLERKNDDDVRMKSVWGATSPFPSVLSGTPQQSESRILMSSISRADVAQHLYSILSLTNSRTLTMIRTT